MSAAILALAAVTATTAPATPTCDATTEVVSEERCFRFGQRWSVERSFRLVLGTGFFTGSTEPSDRMFSLRNNSDSSSSSSPSTSLDGRDLGLGPVRTYGLDVDLHGFVSTNAYIGLDFAFGLGRASHQAFGANGYTYAPNDGPDLVQARMGGTIGVRVPFDSVSLRFETLIGGEFFSISHRAISPSGATSTASSSTGGFLLEPRVALDLWMTPWSTVTIYAGKDVFHVRDLSTGLVFSLHGRPYDGAH